MVFSGSVKKKLAFGCLGLMILSGLGIDYVFDIPDTSQVIELKTSSEAQKVPDMVSSGTTCSELTDGSLPVDNNGELRVLVWNIYKENRTDWGSALNDFSRHRQLLLLQESSLSSGFQSWLAHHPYWQAVQAHAFSVLDKPVGVMNLSGYLPLSSCAYTIPEPWFRLPKSALVSYYLLSDQRTLAVANIHAINFTLGVTQYQKQLIQLAGVLKKHHGPVIFAGDFNSWNEQRMNLLRQVMDSLSMKEVAYNMPDHRKQFSGYPLDHLFYRGLVLNQVKVPQTPASDHNPILASFYLKPPLHL